MADDQELSIQLTADASGLTSGATQGGDAIARLDATIAKLVSSIEPLNGRFSALEGAMNKTASTANTATAAVDKVASSTRGAGGEIERATAAGGPFLGFLADGAEHSRQFSMALNAMGLEGSAAMSRMLGLGQFLNGLGSALPAILAIGAGVAAISVSAELLRKSVDAAGELQQSMMVLGNAVKNQGGDWAALSARVKGFADEQERLTQFSNLAVIQSLNKLVETGMSVADAMTVVRVAEDAAAGTGKSLMDVTQALMQAEHGRTRVLSELGIGTRQSIHDGMSFDSILGQIEQHMGGAAQAAANTYRGSLEQLHNEWEHLLQDVGTPFLGMMTNMVKGFEDTVTAVDDATGSFQGVAPEIERTLGDMKSLGAEVIPMVSEELIGLDHILGGDAVNAWGAVRDAINSTVGTLDAAVNGIRQAIGAVKDMVQAGSDAGNFVNNQVRKIPFIGGALAGADDSIGGSANNPGRLTSQDAAQWAQVQAWGRSVGSQVSTHTDFNPMVGGPLAKKGGNAAPFSFSPEQITAQPVTEDLKGQSDVVKQLTEAFAGLPKSVDGYNQALAQLKPLIEADQKNENDLAIATDKAQQTYGQAVNAYNSGVAGLRNAQQAYDDYGKSLDGVTKLSKDQKEGLNSLKQSVDDQKQHLDNLKATLNDSKKAYDDLAGSLQKTQTELDGLTKLYQQNQNAINKLSTDWEQYVQKTNMANEESYLSFKMTNEQKYDYYKTFAANIHVVDDATLREKEEAYSKEGQAYNAMLEQEQNSLQKFDQLMQTNTQSMLNELISQHKGASGVIKSIWNDLLQAFIEMCAKMIAESKLVASAEQLFMGMFGGGGAGQSIPDFMNMIDAGGPGSPTGGPSARGGKGIGSAGTSGGVGGGTSGGSIGGGVASPMGRGGFSSSGGAGAGGGYASPGATGSGSFSGFGVGGGFGVGSQGPWASSTAGGSAASPSGSTLLSSGLGLASRFGGGMLGAGLLSGAGGEMLSRMVFGNSAGSEIGGLAGGAAGGILGMLLDRGALIPALSLTGPIGIAAIAALAAAGALFGGGIGSMFGDHFPKADEPDIYQQQQWGQELADLQGSSGGNPMIANGKGFTMDSWTSSQTSGKGWNVLMEDFVAKFRNTQKVLPQELRDGFGEMEKLWGGAQNHADFNSNGKNGMLQLGSGEMAQWTTFWQYINAYGPAVAQLMNQYTSADLYSASLNGTASQMGGYTPGGSPWLIHNFPDVGLPMGSSAGAPEVMIAPSGVSKKTATNINIIQQFGGSSIADANMKNYIIKAIAELPLFAHSDINFN